MNTYSHRHPQLWTRTGAHISQIRSRKPTHQANQSRGKGHLFDLRAAWIPFGLTYAYPIDILPSTHLTVSDVSGRIVAEISDEPY